MEKQLIEINCDRTEYYPLFLFIPWCFDGRSRFDTDIIINDGDAICSMDKNIIKHERSILSNKKAKDHNDSSPFCLSRFILRRSGR